MVRWAAATTGLAAGAETKERFGMDGVLIFCLEAVRNVLAKDFEAMMSDLV